MKFRLAALSLFLPAALLFAADIGGPDSVKAQRTITLKVIVPDKYASVWKVVPLDGQDEKDIEWISDKKGPVIRFIGPAGKYRVAVTVAGILKDGTFDLDTGEKVVTLGGEPAPSPPGPGPGPGPAPTPAGGLRVLMLYESEDETKIPRGQQTVLFGRQVRDYLNAKCVKGPDGKTKEYRIYDKDIDLSGESKELQEMAKKFLAPADGKARPLPYIVIQNEKGYYDGPLPESQEKALELLKKFGG